MFGHKISGAFYSERTGGAPLRDFLVRLGKARYHPDFQVNLAIADLGMAVLNCIPRQENKNKYLTCI